MASSWDSWMKEYNDAVKLADDISGMISGRSSIPASGPETQRHASAIRRKITILGTKLDSLQTLLTKLPGKQQTSEKEMNRRKDMVANLRTKVNQMASALNMLNFANRDSLLGPEIKSSDATSRTNGLDNYGLVGLQRQIMKEQDDGLEKLEVTVMSTKHIALAVNEELGLHTRLIDDLDQHVDVTDSRLARVQKHLAVLNKLLHVHAFSSCRDCGSGCRHIHADQILVATATTSFFSYFLSLCNLPLFPTVSCSKTLCLAFFLFSPLL